MTSSAVAGGAVEGASVSADLAPAFGRLVGALLQATAVKLSHKTDEWIREMDEFAASEGATVQAGYEGLKARLRGKNPAWAALKGAWSGASVQLRLAAVLILVLVLLLAPVMLVLLVLGLLIAALIAGIRAATR